VLKGYHYLRGHREKLIPFNPENGWGNYEQFLEFTLDFFQHLVTAEDELRIHASR
jgi:hypothetical protein